MSETVGGAGKRSSPRLSSQLREARESKMRVAVFLHLYPRPTTIPPPPPHTPNATATHSCLLIHHWGKITSLPTNGAPRTTHHGRRPTNSPRTAHHGSAPRKRLTNSAPRTTHHGRRTTDGAPRTAHHGRRTTDGAPRTAHERRPTEAPHEQRPTDGAPQDGGGQTDDTDGKGPSVPKALPLTACIAVHTTIRAVDNRLVSHLEGKGGMAGSEKQATMGRQTWWDSLMMSEMDELCSAHLPRPPVVPSAASLVVSAPDLIVLPNSLLSGLSRELDNPVVCGDDLIAGIEQEHVSGGLKIRLGYLSESEGKDTCNILQCCSSRRIACIFEGVKYQLECSVVGAECTYMFHICSANMNTAIYCIRSYKPGSATREMIRQKICRVAEVEKARNPQREMRWILMGPPHFSRSDSRKHWTTRGVTDDGSVVATAHIYRRGKSVLYGNGGRWQRDGKLLDVVQCGVPL
ncbi:hypothetical protein BD779DRAFT_1478539 [Infundibulicybe gibba]|nr:hypothetical protein BD779DRAFT_1478539 [Infundibulicybe gibba]